jgi:hypothetical protein
MYIIGKLSEKGFLHTLGINYLTLSLLRAPQALACGMDEKNGEEAGASCQHASMISQWIWKCT